MAWGRQRMGRGAGSFQLDTPAYTAVTSSTRRGRYDLWRFLTPCDSLRRTRQQRIFQRYLGTHSL